MDQWKECVVCGSTCGDALLDEPLDLLQVLELEVVFVEIIEGDSAHPTPCKRLQTL